jgi:hypothetical protein
MSTHARKTAGLALVAPSPPAQRAHQLFAEARRAAQDHLRQLAAAIDAVRTLSEAVVEGGELYAPGVRDLAARLAEDLLWRGKSLERLTGGPAMRAAMAEPAREVG